VEQNTYLNINKPVKIKYDEEEEDEILDES